MCLECIREQNNDPYPLKVYFLVEKTISNR